MTSVNNSNDGETPPPGSDGAKDLQRRLDLEAGFHAFGEAPIICGPGGNGPKGCVDGQVDFGIGIDRATGSVVLNFGTPISALVLSRKKAKELRNGLTEAIQMLKTPDTGSGGR